MLAALPDASHDLLEKAGQRWRLCSQSEDVTLLRLAILRDFVRELHSQKSQCLAVGKRQELPALKLWESRAEKLRDCSPLDDDLKGLHSGDLKIKKRTRLLPEALFTVIDREKLERYDRQWEATLAAEGTSRGWRFWSVQVEIEIPEVEAWNRKFSEQLWPHGIVLFVESVETTPVDSPIWTGRWLVMIHPRFRSPQEVAPLASDPATHWKLLFSPKGH